MKKKIINILLFAGIAVLVGLVVLLIFKKEVWDTLWMTYSFLGCLLLIFVCLNLKFRRYSDLDEALSCLRRTRRALSSVNTSKSMGYMKKITLQNQIANAILLTEDLITGHEFYTLKDNLADMKGMKDRYKADMGQKHLYDKAAIEADVDTIDLLITELKALK